MKMIFKVLTLVLVAIGLNSPVLAEIYAVHSDHLGTPVKLTDSDKRVVWSATNRGFGEGVYNTDPDGDGRKVDMPLRYPGQYADKESGLHYNYFRYYDPTVGRYITSDPIGLAGGINTYSYSNENPITYIDRFGLDANNLGIDIAIPFVGGVEAGVVVFDGENFGGLAGTAGLIDLGLYFMFKKNYAGYASGKIAVNAGVTLGCRSNFDGLDAEASLGVGPGGISISGLDDTDIRDNGLAISIGPSLGYEVFITGTASLTVGDLVRAAMSPFYDNAPDWHGDSACGC